MTAAQSSAAPPLADRRELEDRLRALGSVADQAIDLAGTALILAALDRPRVSLERYVRHLALLRRDVAKLAAKLGASDSLAARIDSLNQVIGERHRYLGDEQTYDDVQNANLMRVIDRRKGLPVMLGILYIDAARAQGWAIDGLAFPGHFLVRLELGGERAILDPFHRGRICAPAELRDLLKALAGVEAELRPSHTAPVDNRDILLRLQNNIKIRLLRDERPEAALEVVEAMLLFAPGNAPLWRESGLLNAHLGKLRAAVDRLETFVDLSGDPQARQEAARALQEIKSRLN